MAGLWRTMAGGVLATALVAMPAEADERAAAPVLDYAFSLRVTVDPAVETGTVDGGRRRFVPITGGTVSGPKLNGAVLPGGGDWQIILPGGLTRIEARYALKAADGTVIEVVNPGVRVASPEVTAQLARGDEVEPAAYYFRTAPRFEVAAGAHDWLRRAVFVARGVRRPDHVLVDVYEVR